MTDAKKKNFPAALEKYLIDNGVSPKILEHKTVYTAIDAANTLKKKMEEIVKSLLVKADNFYYIVCLPADHNLDFKKIKSAIEKTAGVKVKTIQIPVLMEKRVANLKRAVFSAGTFNHSVEIGLKEFIKLENAVLGNFGIKKKVKIINRPSSSMTGKGANKKMAMKKKKAAKKVAKKKTTKKKATKKVAKKKATKKVAKKKATKKKAKKARK